MDSNISFLLFGFRGLISNFQLEITFICSLSLFTFPKECNLLPRACYFHSLLVFSYFKIKLAHFKYWNWVCFCAQGPEQYYKDIAAFEKTAFFFFFLIAVMLLQVPALAVVFQYSPTQNLTGKSFFFFRFDVLTKYYGITFFGSKRNNKLCAWNLECFALLGALNIHVISKGKLS